MRKKSTQIKERNFGHPFTVSRLDGDDTLRIVSWNILAHELSMFFWRSSYGLHVIPSKRDMSHAHYYDAIHKDRLDAIVESLFMYNANIICLQEITSTKYTYLGNKTAQEYIADKLNFIVVNESYKTSEFKYSYPPNENMPILGVHTGVATLYKSDGRLIHIASADIVDKSVESPMTIDHFQTTAARDDLYVTNIHIKMQYPHIANSVSAVYKIMTKILTADQLKRTITIGDFNAHDRLTARELFTSDLHTHMLDLAGAELSDDHVFVGSYYRNYDLRASYGNVPLLQMGVNTAASDRRQWRKFDVPYKLSEMNNDLVAQKIATSDHYPILFTLKRPLDKKERRRHQIS